MKYKIVITVLEPHPQFAAKLAEYTERAKYVNMMQLSYPAETIETKSLETVLSEDEFRAMRNYIVGQFGS